MENALMVGLTRQMVLRRQMDITANNLANMSTAGFKVEKILLRRHEGAPASHQDGPAKISFVEDWGVARNFSDGRIEDTGRPLDVAVVGRGFFAIETPDGEHYTRDGRFSIDNTGTLVASDGMTVLDKAGGPIVMDQNGQSPIIKANGAVIVNDVEVAQLKVVNFASLGVLKKSGDGRYSVPDNTEVLDIENPKLLQAHLERSNVVPISEITRMTEITRAYQSMSNLLKQSEELSKRTVERLGRVR